MNIPLHYEQLQFVLDVASYRNNFLDPIFRFLNYADSFYFNFLLTSFVWVGFSYRWGLRLFYLLVINFILNASFKTWIGWPRPCMDFPDVGMFCPSDFGFPSGGAQTCMLLGGLLIYYWKTRAAWIIGVSYILLISFSRIYLGVHYPLDILGGWAIGLSLLLLYVQLIDPIETFLKSQSLPFCFFLSEALPLLLIIAATASYCQPYDAMAVGLGAFLSLKYRLYLSGPKTIIKGLLRGAIAAGMLFLIFALLPSNLSISLSLGIVSLWISLGASPVCKHVLRI